MYERGERLKVKIHILLYTDISQTAALRQIKCGIEKITDIPTSFNSVSLFDKAFKYLR
jgi:hypothetical protein